MCGIHGSWFDCVKNVNSSRTQRFDRSSGFLFMFYFLTQFVCKFEQMIMQKVFFSKTKYTFDVYMEPFGGVDLPCSLIWKWVRKPVLFLIHLVDLVDLVHLVDLLLRTWSFESFQQHNGSFAARWRTSRGIETHSWRVNNIFNLVQWPKCVTKKALLGKIKERKPNENSDLNIS